MYVYVRTAHISLITYRNKLLTYIIGVSLVFAIA